MIGFMQNLIYIFLYTLNFVNAWREKYLFVENWQLSIGFQKYHKKIRNKFFSDDKFKQFVKFRYSFFYCVFIFTKKKIIFNKIMILIVTLQVFYMENWEILYFWNVLSFLYEMWKIRCSFLMFRYSRLPKYIQFYRPLINFIKHHHKYTFLIFYNSFLILPYDFPRFFNLKIFYRKFWKFANIFLRASSFFHWNLLLTSQFISFFDQSSWFFQ